MVKAKIMKKEWYPILAPKIFGNVVLGETPAFEPGLMLGKGLTKNLMSLTNDAKRQNININFEIINVQNGKAFTDVVGYYMAQSSIRRLVRRNVEKIDMSFSCKTSDNKNLQVKPILITRSATTGSVAAKIRRNAQDFIVNYIGKITYDNFVNDIVSHKLQSYLKKGLNKIYPLRICEIRSMEIVDLEKKKKSQSEAKAGIKAESKPIEKEMKKPEENKAAEKTEAKADAGKSEIHGNKVSGTTDVVSGTHSMEEKKETMVKEDKAEQAS